MLSGVLRTALLCCLAVAGCGTNVAPDVRKIPDLTAAVGLELTVQIHAHDTDGDALRYTYEAPELPDLDQRQPPATLTGYSDGIAIFHWIPAASDSRPEPYELDFKVSDGKTTTTMPMHVTVRDQNADGAPEFVKPTGSGTTLLLDESPCIEVPVEVADTDSTAVTIAQEDPLIDGATLNQDGAFTASWKWCPTPMQVQQQDRFYLRLSADDQINPKTQKPPYLVVVVSAAKGGDCPGGAPTIASPPLGAQTTVQDLKITLSAGDDQGLKSTPLLYWSLTDPGAAPNVTKMNPVATVQVSGDARAGTYEATIPNPVASAAPGTTKTVYYLLVARDNDDPTGGCNHATVLPTSGVFSFTVTGAASAGAAACAACTGDAQCGGADDNCVTIGGEQRCATACDSGGGCPGGYTCTSAAVVSADGRSMKQCVPTSGTCATPTTCVDDALEENDSQASITNATAASLGGTSYPDLMICPLAAGGVDEDWFGLPVTVEGQVAVSIASTATTDLDLELFDAAGNLLGYGLSLTSNEQVSACVHADAGKVYARVFSLSSKPAAAPYALSVARTPMTCPCVPDSLEPDDQAADAYPFGRPAPSESLSGLTLCPGNLDFFAVALNGGDRVVVDLTFDQKDSNSDLDIHFYARDGVSDLTPCSPTQSGCLSTNGQGYQSNEHFEWTIPSGQGGTYYVVVRGFDAADSAPYAIKVGLK